MHETEINYQVVESLINIENKTLVPVLFQMPEDEMQANDFILSNCLTHFAVMHPGTRRELKKWPLDRFENTFKVLGEFWMLCELP